MINPAYLQREFAVRFRASFSSGTLFTDVSTDALLRDIPFPVATLPNFISDPSLVERLSSCIPLLPSLTHKVNDLHDFYQSKDLIKTRSSLPSGSPLLELISAIEGDEIRNMLQDITGLVLTPGEIDLAAQVYQPGGHLLCHDDALEGRRIAFVLYLVDEKWSDANGGTLDLFSASAVDGSPLEPVASILPQRNMLMFFEVTPVSFHQVAEVLCSSRVSVAGWFHGPPPYHQRAEFLSAWRHLVQQDPQSEGPSGRRTIELEENAWMSPGYLGEKVKAAARKAFLSQGFIQLAFFMSGTSSEKTVSSFTPDGALVGPANYRRMLLVSPHGSPFLSTNPLWMSFLSYMAAGTLALLDESVYFCGPGHYHLIHDDYQDYSGRGIDVLFFFKVKGDAVSGGSWRYIVGSRGKPKSRKREDDVLEIEPAENSLFLIKTSRDTQRCMDYIRRAAGARSYFVAILRYALSASKQSAHPSD